MSHAEIPLQTALPHSTQFSWRRILLISTFVALVGGGVWWAAQTQLLDGLLESRTTTSTTTSTTPAEQLSASQWQATTNDTGQAASAMVDSGATANETETTAAANSATLITDESTPMTVANDAASKPVSLVAVAGIDGVQLWSAEGNLLTTLDIGARLKATARTVDGQWLTVETDNATGWAQAAQIIAFDLEDLPVTTLAAPVAVASAQPSMPAASAESPSEQSVTTVAETTLPIAADTTLTDAPVTNAASAEITAVVATSGANLNVRSGPGTDYALVAKVANGAQVTVLGRDESGDWLQVQLSSVTDEVGWVAMTYVQLDSPVNKLPVVIVTAQATTP